MQGALLLNQALWTLQDIAVPHLNSHRPIVGRLVCLSSAVDKDHLWYLSQEQW